MTDYRALGVVEANRDGVPVAIGGPKQRCLLAVLLAADQKFTPIDQVVDALWGDEPPAKTSVSLRAYASNLRQVLDAGQRLESRSYGFRLALGPQDTFDLNRFDALVADGRAALATGQCVTAATTMSNALNLWHGAPFGEFAERDFARATVERWKGLRLTAIEARFDALVHSGHGADLVGDIEGALTEFPLQERLWGHLMTALHRAGRTGDALLAYDRVRGLLDVELGTRPGDGLRQLFADLNRPIDVAPAPTQLLPQSSPPRPFVGRDDETTEIAAAARRVTAGSGALIVVTGVSGVGKTQLAARATQIDPVGLPVVWATHPDRLSVPAMWTWIQVIRDVGAILGPDARAHLLRSRPDVAAALVPEWRPTDIDSIPAATGFTLVDGIVTLLRHAVSVRPFVVVLDDLHAADDESLSVLELLRPQLARIPLLIVATWTLYGRHRPVAPDRFARLMASGSSTSLSLVGLNSTETSCLVKQLVDGATDDEVGRVWTHSGGNPFFIGELIRSRDRNVRPVESEDITDSAAELVSTRLRELDPTSTELLITAAVIGPRFGVTALADVADLPVSRVQQLLADAFQLGLIDEIDDLPGSFAFGHGIVRAAVLSTATPLTRSRAHARIAQHHPQTFAPIAYEDAIATADHAWRAGAELDAEIALELHEQAIDHALRRSAYRDAETTINHALQVSDRMARKPETLDRQATLCLQLAGAAAILHGHGSVELARAVARAVDLGQHTAGRNYFGAVAVRCHVLCGQGRLEEASAIVAALETNHDVAESAAGLAVLFGKVMLNGLIGKYQSVLDAAADLLSTYPVPETSTDPLYFFHPRVHCFAAIAHANLGDAASARESCGRAMELAQSRGDVFNLLAAQVTSVEVDVLVGLRPTTADEAGTVAERLLAAGAPQWAACAQMVQAWAQSQTAPHPDTSATAREAYAAYTFDGGSAMTPYFLVLRADIESRCNRTTSAADLLNQAQSIAMVTGEHAWDQMIARRRNALT